MTPRNQHQHRKIVQTPYGEGIITKQEASGRSQVKLSGFGGTLYTHGILPSIPPKVGDDVICTYGRGTVLEINPNTQKCKVQLSSWRLANRNTVTCYLQTSTLQVVSKKTIREMNTYERVQHGLALKSTATQHFTQKSYTKALQLYSEAIDAVRFVQHDANSDNYIRADLVLLMITCSNNAATCSIQLEKYDEAYRFATNALVLLDALYEKRGKKIHTILNEDGFKDEKLFGEFGNKSRLVIATSCYSRNEVEKAIERLKQAEASTAEYLKNENVEEKSKKVLRMQEKQIKKLHAQCLHKRRIDKKKEIKRAQAMFGGGAAAASPSAPSKSSSETDNRNVTATASQDESTHDDKKFNPTTPPTPKASSLRRTPSDIKKVVTFAPPEKNQTVHMDDEKKNDDSDLDDIVYSEMNGNGNGDNDDEDEEMMPWYEEHKEALILLGVAGLAGLSTMLLRSSKS